MRIGRMRREAEIQKQIAADDLYDHLQSAFAAVRGLAGVVPVRAPRTGVQHRPSVLPGGLYPDGSCFPAWFRPLDHTESVDGRVPECKKRAAGCLRNPIGAASCQYGGRPNIALNHFPKSSRAASESDQARLPGQPI